MTVSVNELRMVSGLLYTGVSTREGVLGRRAGQLYVVPQKPGEGTGTGALLLLILLYVEVSNHMLPRGIFFLFM